MKWLIWYGTSEVTIIKIDTKITIFRKIEQNGYHKLRSKCDSIPILHCLRGTGDDAGGHRMGYTPPQVRSRRVEEFISPLIWSCWVQRSLYLQIRILGQKIEIELFIKNLIKIELRGKHHNRHITIRHYWKTIILSITKFSVPYKTKKSLAVRETEWSLYHFKILLH